MDRTVVCVSSDPQFLERKGNVLDRRGTVVVPAADPAELAQRLADAPVDLVVVDGTGPWPFLEAVLAAVQAETTAESTAVVVVVPPERRAKLPAWLEARARTQVMTTPCESGELLAASARLAGWTLRRHLRVMVQVRVKAEDGERTVFGFTRDLSEGGMGFFAKDELPVGATVLARFGLPGNPREIAVRARVLRAGGFFRGYQYGLSFVDPIAKHRSAIRAFVETETARAEHAPRLTDEEVLIEVEP